MPHRLSINNEKLFPVQAFFNAIGNDSFLEMVRCLARGVGFSCDEVDCSFASDLDPGETPFEGVRFSLFEESVIVSRSLCWSYLNAASAAYLSKYPEHQAELLKLLAEFQHGDC